MPATATPVPAQTRFDRLLVPYVCPALPTDKQERSHRKVDGTPKRGYADWRRAAAEARSMTIRGLGQLRAYRCPECKHWHTGNVEPRPNGPLAVVRIDPAAAELATPPAPEATPVSQPTPTPTPPRKALARRVGADLFRRVRAVQALVQAGATEAAACREAGVDAATFRHARASLNAGAMVVNAPSAKGAHMRKAPGPPDRAKAARDRERRAADPLFRFYKLLCQRVYHRRRTGPAEERGRWIGVPLPRLRDGRPVLRAEHLALLTGAERRALFGSPR